MGILFLGVSPLFASSPLAEQPKGSTHQGGESGCKNLEGVTEFALTSRFDELLSLLDLSRSSEGEGADKQDFEILMTRNEKGRYGD